MSFAKEIGLIDDAGKQVFPFKEAQENFMGSIKDIDLSIAGFSLFHPVIAGEKFKIALVAILIFQLISSMFIF